MDKETKRLILELITLIITLIASILVTHQITAQDYGACVLEAAMAQEELKKARAELAELKPKYGSLQKDFKNLGDKYGLCAKVDHVVYEVSLLERGPISFSLEKIDAVKFKLSSSDLLFRLSGVARQKAEVGIEGCANPGLFEGKTSEVDGSSAVVLSPGSTARILASTECCVNGLHNCETGDLDEFTIECHEVNVDGQTAHLSFTRSAARR